MMQYSKTNIIGDAGEHLLAAKIIKLFGFPCRLIGIDIGIDAEIEIIDKNYKSTGEFLKCQIKTTEKEDFHVYVKERHIRYWNSVNIPVIVFLVHLNTEQIYWHCIKDVEQYDKSGKSIRIGFDVGDILQESNKENFVDLVYFKSFEAIRKIYDEAYTIAHADTKNYLKTGNYDYTTIEHFVGHLFKMEYEFQKVARLKRQNKVLDKIDIEYADKLKVIYKYIRKVTELKEQVEEDEPDCYEHLKSENFDWD